MRLLATKQIQKNCIKRFYVLASTPFFSIGFLKSLKRETPLVSMALTAESIKIRICVMVCKLHVALSNSLEQEMRNCCSKMTITTISRKCLSAEQHRLEKTILKLISFQINFTWQFQNHKLEAWLFFHFYFCFIFFYPSQNPSLQKPFMEKQE